MPRPFRIAATADIHYGRDDEGRHQALFAAASEAADVLLLCGDLTNYGTAEEARVLAHDLRQHADVPILAVLGNHDFESGTVAELSAVLHDEAGVHLLDGTCAEVEGVGFAGVRGFGGGFGRWALSRWGEPLWKALVQEVVDEELKLDAALGRLQTPQRVALLHYAPIADTVAGEPEVIFPFLGSSRLEEPLNRYEVSVAFHGHAHAGAPEGVTAGGVPVYNVSVPVLERHYPDRPPFRLLELALDVDPAPSDAAWPATEV